MSEFHGGQKVKARRDLSHTDRFDTTTQLARKGQVLIIRSTSPLEVSSLTQPLLAFDVTEDDIEPI